MTTVFGDSQGEKIIALVQRDSHKVQQENLSEFNNTCKSHEVIIILTDRFILITTYSKLEQAFEEKDLILQVYKLVI